MSAFSGDSHDLESPGRCTCVKFWWVLKPSFNVSENVKLIQYLLFRLHGTCSMTRCFSWLFAENVIENSLFTNAYRNYNFQVFNGTFWGNSLINDLLGKVVLEGMGVPNFLKEGMENRAETRKMPSFPGFRGGLLQFVPETLEYPPLYFSDDQSASLTAKLDQKNWEAAFLDQFQTVPSIFSPPPPPSTQPWAKFVILLHSPIIFGVHLVRHNFFLISYPVSEGLKDRTIEFIF